MEELKEVPNLRWVREHGRWSTGKLNSESNVRVVSEDGR